MKRNINDIDSGFGKKFLDDFIDLHRQAEKKQDEVRMKSINILIAGIMEITRLMETTVSVHGQPLRFSATAVEVFLNLTKRPIDPLLLRIAGTHYLVEWDRPAIALRHFRGALALSKADKTIPMLIEIATLVLRRKNAEAGLTPSLTMPLPTKPGRSSGR